WAWRQVSTRHPSPRQRSGVAGYVQRTQNGLMAAGFQQPIDARPTDSERLRNLRGAQPLRPQFTHLRGLYGGLPAPVDASGLGLGDAFKLTLTAQVRFEFGEHPEHIEEALSGGRAGIDRLFRRFERCAAGLHLAHDVLKVADAAGETIDPSDHENVAL